jgi:hypothetical protein
MSGTVLDPVIVENFLEFVNEQKLEAGALLPGWPKR